MSDPIRNLEVTKSSEIISYHKYEYKVRINFQEPCNTNDIFLYYMIEERGIKQGYQEVYTKINVTKTYYESVLRKPDYNYEFIISVVTDKFVSKTVTKNVSTSAGGEYLTHLFLYVSHTHHLCIVGLIYISLQYHW